MQEEQHTGQPQAGTEAAEPAAEQAAASGQSRSPAEPIEAQADLAEQLRRAEAQAAEKHEALLRAVAETENVRKRAQADAATAQKFAVESFASELLAVRDSLEAALAADKVTVEQIRGGVELTLKQLASVFEKFHLKEIDPAGERFDPHRHQAMCALDSEQEPNTVLNVMQKGYLLHDRVIRPALVTVAKAKDA
jgi:molecular chaperone GrpE